MHPAYRNPAVPPFLSDAGSRPGRGPSPHSPAPPSGAPPTPCGASPPWRTAEPPSHSRPSLGKGQGRGGRGGIRPPHPFARNFFFRRSPFSCPLRNFCARYSASLGSMLVKGYFFGPLRPFRPAPDLSPRKPYPNVRPIPFAQPFPSSQLLWAPQPPPPGDRFPQRSAGPSGAHSDVPKRSPTGGPAGDFVRTMFTDDGLVEGPRRPTVGIAIPGPARGAPPSPPGGVGGETTVMPNKLFKFYDSDKNAIF